MTDTRNVTDEFKGRDHAAIVAELDQRGVSLEIAIENTLRDFNMGTIVRSANAFGVRTVHVIGRRQWNKRGAMMTDKYLTVWYHASVEDFVQTTEGKVRVAVDNVPGAAALGGLTFADNTVLIFGQEGPGLSSELLAIADQTVAIEQLGSTRSLNVGVAAGVVMYEWLRQRVLTKNTK